MGAGILGSVIQAAVGAEQSADALEAINNLPEYSRYEAISEIKDMYSQLSRLSRNPYSAASNTAFKGAMAQGGSNAYNRGIANDPSLSGALLGGVQVSGMNQYGQREMQGDRLMQGYLQSQIGLGSMMQGLDTETRREFNQRLLMQEQALGAALAAGNEKTYQGVVGIGAESEATMGNVMKMIFAGGQGQKEVDLGSMPNQADYQQNQGAAGGGQGGGQSAMAGPTDTMGGAPSNGDAEFSGMGQLGGMFGWGM